VLTATLLALAAAVLHAGWNLLIKQSGDRWISLWGMFFVAGVLAAFVYVAMGGMPASGWWWAGATGLVHIGYTVGLARAYDHGDFSVSYPVARGGGALLAAIGGVALLGDHLSLLSSIGLAVVVAGLALLAVGQGHVRLAPALGVAVTIGVYTLIDAEGSRRTDTNAYAMAVYMATATTTTIWGLARGRRREMVAALRTRWLPFAVVGTASALAYALVLAAVRLAPVGYVTALRESSVVLAALAGWKLLGEAQVHRRLAAAGIVLAGLVLLVSGG
jgi:multidrug transporter EmrE-like cation transporter